MANKKNTSIRYSMCGDRLALREIKQKEKEMIGSLYIPTESAERAIDLAKAEVLAIGPDVKTVKLGDIIVTPHGLGTHLLDGDKKYTVLPENAIMAIDNGYKPEEDCE